MISRRQFMVSGLWAAAIGGLGYGLWPRLNKYDEELAYQRQLIQSDPDLVEFVRMATLAANGHNTQPWSFLLGSNSIRILPDYARRTEVVDPDDHHLFVSLGCAAENLIQAAGAHGRMAEVLINTDAEPSIDIMLDQGPPSDDSLYQAIPLRQSTRSIFDGQPLAASEIETLQGAARQDGVSVLFFTDEPDREAILDLVVEGNSAQMDDPAFVDELREWIRFSPSRAIASGDGLFSACSGNPVVPEWLGGPMFRAFFTKDTENTNYRDQIRSSAGIAVFIGDRADPEHWINVGRSFERFALQATTMGIRNAHINQPVEVPAVRAEFASWLGMPDIRPDLIVRFGRAPALPMSLRRPVESVLA